jgi:predicted ATP-grasp superfamily ATP-dependent carboligase
MIAAYGKKKVLVLGDYRQTITVVRSLGRAGFRVVLACDRPHSSTALSRYVAAARLIDASSPDRYCESLKACVEQDRPDFVFPVGESELRRLLQGGRHPLAGLSTWIMPDPQTVLRCFDKRAMYHLASSLGIPVCAWRPFSSAAAMLRDAAELGFPVVVKRKDSSAMLLGNNAIILYSALQLEQFITELQSDPDQASLMLQKHGAGQRHNCHFAADGGRIVAYFQQKVLRTDKPDGTGIGIEGISVAPAPPLRSHCERLLHDLRYTGIGCIQFLVDERTGATHFLELNARMDSTAVLPYRLGIDFPLIALKIAAREPVSAPEHYDIGKRYYYLYGALNVWLAQRHREPIRRIVAWPLTAPWRALRSYDLILEWRDPLPALHQIARRIIQSASKRSQRPMSPPPGKAPVESSVRP